MVGYGNSGALIYAQPVSGEASLALGLALAKENLPASVDLRSVAMMLLQLRSVAGSKAASKPE